ncbi:hypothetical protein SBOR_2622 [Sclerotinia borealis F-4128]|uniref:Gfd2/YDR514C-like C-terminal domain-containing protein n=1 Tax=Sclerotinia borealis (strain F-4128) TaxID=1432307 RepID=W9CR71_SCLBF|nr:hypothetical protein SBOR_2622 [Sclerotinia borealis F-4128]
MILDTLQKYRRAATSSAFDASSSSASASASPSLAASTFSSASPSPAVSAIQDASSLDSSLSFAPLSLAPSTSGVSPASDDVSRVVPVVNPCVYIAIDLEATTEQWEYYGPGRRQPGQGRVFPRASPTEIGISILRATGDNAELFAKDPKSKDPQAPKRRPLSVRQHQVFPLARVDEVIRDLVAEESKHGQVVLVGHAIGNDQRYLNNGNISAFNAYFSSVQDTQMMHRESRSGNGKSLKDLVRVYDENAGEGWHNAGNDAMWTLWVHANKVRANKLAGKDSCLEKITPREPVPSWRYEQW